jgi:hypothetical protein
MPVQDVRVLVQEHPVQLVERVAGRCGYQPSGIGGIGCLRLSRANRSKVLIALAFATDWRPDRGRERASRRSSATVWGSRSPLPLSGTATRGVVCRIAFSALAYAAVFGVRGHVFVTLPLPEAVVECWP